MKTTTIVFLLAAVLATEAGAQNPDWPLGPRKPTWSELHGQKGVEAKGSVGTASEALEVAEWWGNFVGGRRDYTERENMITEKAREQLAANPTAPGTLIVIERRGQGMGARHFVDVAGSGTIPEAIAAASAGKVTERRPGEVSGSYGVYVARNGERTIISSQRLGMSPALKAVLRQETARFNAEDKDYERRIASAKQESERRALREEQSASRREHAERVHKTERMVELREKGEETTSKEREELAQLAEEAQRKQNVGRTVNDPEDQPMPEWAEGLTDEDLKDPAVMMALVDFWIKSKKADPRAPYVLTSDIQNFKERYSLEKNQFGVKLTPKIDSLRFNRVGR
ncbi:hypothetical protein [Sphingomonas panaciterrae]|uniref:hypothetical protein n=1 Tax=Sphingomonas panaciterrae TaxID=1462999 RepID=UPI002FF3681F